MTAPTRRRREGSVQDQITAHHEAAHAVIGRILGDEILKLTIDPAETPDRRSLGYCSSRQWSLLGVEDRPLLVQRAVRRQRAAVSLAGPVAEGALVVREGWEDSELGSFEFFEFNAADLYPSDHDGACAFHLVQGDWTELEWVHDVTTRAVHASWRRICAVAKELADARTIERPDRSLVEGRGSVWYQRAHAALRELDGDVPSPAARRRRSRTRK